MSIWDDYQFKDPLLLETALTHKSYANERARTDKIEHNEKLEFLGDSVLQLILTEALMEFFPSANEGHLSKWRAQLVREETLARLAVDNGLSSKIRFGRGEFLTGGELKSRLVACAFEALIGALYIDCGFLQTRDIVRKIFAEELDQFLTGQAIDRDYKSQLQEKAQSLYKQAPIYELAEKIGPAHEAQFRVKCIVNDTVLSEAVGKSKKVAEQLAAEIAILKLEQKKVDQQKFDQKNAENRDTEVSEKKEEV